MKDAAPLELGQQLRQPAPARGRLNRHRRDGSVVSTGLLWVHTSDKTARAVVAAAGSDSTGGATPSQRHYRWVLTLLNKDGRWLDSDVALEGVPS